MDSASTIGWMDGLAAASAGAAAFILLMHLLRRPPLVRSRLWLLLGLGVFPIGAAGTTNIAGFKATQSRKFCGSCHVMEPHARDVEDPQSRSLAAIHGRNHAFGQDNCYACHKDYGMYGYVITKMGGMGHVYWYLTEYHDMPLEQSKHAIRIKRPLPNENCMSCHTTTAPRWLGISDHASTLESVRSGQLSCASPGCHGYAHPVTKIGKELGLDGGLHMNLDASSPEASRP
jgi:nitrate/TMAO reductase-like tetraheme cytochrome c subunit